MLGRVLVIEDNVLVRESFVELLSQRGYEVVEATDGEDALGKLRKKSCDVAVVDVMMPTMGGLEFREEAKTAAPGVNIIFVTGQPDRFEQLVEDDDDYIEGRMNVLFKPVHPVKLLAEIEKVMAKA
ncbi:MAG: response regulator [Rhodospirillaceae bacterium]|nr:response regulator [Rhodospirillaceae bacterium]